MKFVKLGAPFFSSPTEKLKIKLDIKMHLIATGSCRLSFCIHSIAQTSKPSKPWVLE